ncbi:hypothetical protein YASMINEVIRUS_719 [Yasminevirus sp. GU-2018]|uniref:Uncharacterized protein n=1 Tax=Yasminevirus sp. GU-2018 TaxID=2420051 RepID=A0A5K0UAX1_9VIRU|nr:hypothetical protein YASMINEVIRUS_719 [Yasminevirus sp. GU-2018]
MDSYCDINNAYTDKGVLINNFNSASTDANSLEKLARQVNSNKKSRTKDVYRQYRKNTVDMAHDAQAFNEFLVNQTDKSVRPTPYFQRSNDSGVSPSAVIPDGKAGGFYSAQGDYLENTYRPSSTSGTLIKNIMKEQEIKKEGKKKKKTPKYEDVSLDTPSQKDSESSDSSNSSSSSFSSITWDTREIDKQVKTKAKFDSKKKSKRHKCIDFDLDSVDSLESLDSGESLLRHIRFCRECKDKVIDLIRKNKSSHKHLSKLSHNTLHSLSALNTAVGGKLNGVDESKFEYNNYDLYDHVNEPSTEIITERGGDGSRSSRGRKQTHSVEHMNDDCSDEKTNKNVNTSNQKSGQESSMPEIKEIVTVCLIGFLVIMILDLMMRAK